MGEKEDDGNELSGKLSDYWWQTCFVYVRPPTTMARLAACLKEFDCWESFLERKKLLKMFCICRRWDWKCIKMLIENVATALRMDEAKLDSIEDPSFHLTPSFKESETFFDWHHLSRKVKVIRCKWK